MVSHADNSMITRQSQHINDSNPTKALINILDKLQKNDEELIHLIKRDQIDIDVHASESGATGVINLQSPVRTPWLITDVIAVWGVFNATQNDSLVFNTASPVLNPGAGATILNITGLSQLTTYNVQWNVTLSGTVTSGDSNNMQLSGLGLNNAPTAFYPGVVGTYPQPTIQVTPFLTTATVKSIAAASGAAAGYSAQTIFTPTQ